MHVETDKILPRSFYERPNVVEIAKDLLGKVMVSNVGGMLCKGKIVEVEAYCGRADKACHAYNGRRTKRTETMYAGGGVAYVYLCYGIHHLFNVVTNIEGMADAVLIRALEPISGMQTMKERLKSKNNMLTNGPGILSKSMSITTQLNGADLLSGKVWIEYGDSNIEMIETQRIGIDYAEEDALLPWRFYVKGNEWVSRK